MPALALETTQRTLQEQAQRLLNLYQHSLAMSRPDTAATDLQQIGTVLDQAYEFVLRIPSAADDPAVAAHISALLHAIDHMQRLRGRLQYQPGTDLLDQRYQHARSLASELTTLAQQSLHAQAPVDWQEQMQIRAQSQAQLLDTVRGQLLAAPKDRTMSRARCESQILTAGLSAAASTSGAPAITWNWPVRPSADLRGPAPARRFAPAVTNKKGAGVF